MSWSGLGKQGKKGVRTRRRRRKKKRRMKRKRRRRNQSNRGQFKFLEELALELSLKGKQVLT
jgi:hypothetical protein